MSTSLTTRPHFSHNSSVINRLLSNYAKARDQLSAKTSFRHNLRFIRSKQYLLTFAFNVRVIFDNVRRPNKPHSASFFTQKITLPAIQFVAMARFRNNLKTNQHLTPNSPAHFISQPQLRPINLFMFHVILMTFTKHSLITSINTAQYRLFSSDLDSTSDAKYSHKLISSFHNTYYANEWQTLPSQYSELLLTVVRFYKKNLRQMLTVAFDEANRGFS